MYGIANEEAANEELAYQNEFLSEFVGELCMWEEYDNDRNLQDLSNWFAQACMDHEIQPRDAINIFKSFWSIGLRTALHNEIQDHKRKIRERYKTATEWFETKFPNGLGYLHPKTNEYIGVNIITKQFIKEFLEAYEDSNFHCDECNGTTFFARECGNPDCPNDPSGITAPPMDETSMREKRKKYKLK